MSGKRPVERARSFAEHFQVDEAEVQRLGFVDVFLNRDSRLFIDPKLIEVSPTTEISDGATASLRRFFDRLVLLLRNSRQRGDTPWREAARMTKFDEVPWTRLGYVRRGSRGTGMGPVLTARMLETAKEIVDLGIEDPRLFHALPLLEEGVGPDRISDLTTNIILPDLARYTRRCCEELEIATEERRVRRRRRHFPVAPAADDDDAVLEPVILVPRNIVSDLPMACDFDEVIEAAEQNEAIREDANRVFGGLLADGVKRSEAKSILRGRALSTSRNFRVVLEAVLSKEAHAYDFFTDPNGEFVIRRAYEAAEQNPLTVDLAALRGDVRAVADAIVDRFKFLIEEKGIWKSLYADRAAGTQPLPEDVAQDFFAAVAHSYCDANDLDITPEAETGRGPVDFKLSHGTDRAIVELKKSSNPKLVHGYESQIEAYRKSESAKHAVYLVVDVGKLGKKLEVVYEKRNAALARGETPPDVVYVDGRARPSASKE